MEWMCQRDSMGARIGRGLGRQHVAEAEAVAGGGDDGDNGSFKSGGGIAGNGEVRAGR